MPTIDRILDQEKLNKASKQSLLTLSSACHSVMAYAGTHKQRSQHKYDIFSEVKSFTFSLARLPQSENLVLVPDLDIMSLMQIPYALKV